MIFSGRTTSIYLWILESKYDVHTGPQQLTWFDIWSWGHSLPGFETMSPENFQDLVSLNFEMERVSSSADSHWFFLSISTCVCVQVLHPPSYTGRGLTATVVHQKPLKQSSCSDYTMMLSILLVTQTHPLRKTMIYIKYFFTVLIIFTLQRNVTSVWAPGLQ